MPPELAQQMPVLKQLLADLGFVSVSCEGWEADDILGTLAAACAARKDDCLLATGDRDSLQLASETTTILLATNKETIPLAPALISAWSTSLIPGNTRHSFTPMGSYRALKSRVACSAVSRSKP